MSRWHAWMCLCLASLTTACAEQPVTVVTVYQPVYLPERFLVDCSKAGWGGGSFRDVGALAVRRGADIDACNRQLRAAREYQADLRARENGGIPEKAAPVNRDKE